MLVLCLLVMSPNILASIVLGNPEGKTVLTFVYDYQCPYCHEQYPFVIDLQERFPDLKIELLPVGIIGSQSLPLAAEAIVSTQTDGLFDHFTNFVMSQPPETLQASTVLQELPIDKKLFLTQLHDHTVAEQIKEGLLALQKYHRNSVPLIIIAQSTHPNNVVVLDGLQQPEELQEAILHVEGDWDDRSAEG
jgi:protein-disulfide isomerase